MNKYFDNFPLKLNNYYKSFYKFFVTIACSFFTGAFSRIFFIIIENIVFHLRYVYKFDITYQNRKQAV